MTEAKDLFDTFQQKFGKSESQAERFIIGSLNRAGKERVRLVATVLVYAKWHYIAEQLKINPLYGFATNPDLCASCQGSTYWRWETRRFTPVWSCIEGSSYTKYCRENCPTPICRKWMRAMDKSVGNTPRKGSLLYLVEHYGFSKHLPQLYKDIVREAKAIDEDISDLPKPTDKNGN